LNLLRKRRLIKDQHFKIDIKKNIPHGSGLGGASTNASSLLSYLNKKMKLNLKNDRMIFLAKKIGSDVPLGLKKKNTFLRSRGDKILRFNVKFGFNLLIVYPNIVCSTRNIYNNYRVNYSRKLQSRFNVKNRKKLIDYLKNEKNDLQKTTVKIYPKVGKVIDHIKLQKGCLFSRITGSGSACIGIFSNRRDTISAQKLIKLKYPNYWSVVSKTI